MEHVTFNSLGARWAADLYLPETGDPVPGLVLGHSGVMVKEALAFFAPHFVKAGFAVLAVDCRTVGSSEGEPRGLDHPERQVEDFRRRWRSRSTGSTSACAGPGSRTSPRHPPTSRWPP
ncbi:alpha/beta hydrolase [Nonomuraea pusilla]|uniref:alpha/beta hydrolase n=1 Tax=Nonomuraea pusilla TaxID=46177 RepID=UPI0033205C54